MRTFPTKVLMVYLILTQIRFFHLITDLDSDPPFLQTRKPKNTKTFF